jgi:hypothetical protein
MQCHNKDFSILNISIWILIDHDRCMLTRNTQQITNMKHIIILNDSMTSLMLLKRVNDILHTMNSKTKGLVVWIWTLIPLLMKNKIKKVNMPIIEHKLVTKTFIHVFFISCFFANDFLGYGCNKWKLKIPLWIMEASKQWTSRKRVSMSWDQTVWKKCITFFSQNF